MQYFMADIQTKIPAFKGYGSEVFRLFKAREAARGNDRAALEEQLMEYSHTNGKSVENVSVSRKDISMDEV